MWRCSGAIESVERHGLVLVLHQDQGAVLLQAIAGEVAPAQGGQGGAQGRVHPVDQVGFPGDQEARAGRMLGLGDQVRRDETRVGRPVGDQDDLARAGDTVDIDLAEDLTLGQGHEQVAGPDDLIDRRDPLAPIGQGRDGLGPADPVNFGHAERMARGEQVVIESAELRRGNHHGDLADPRRLGGNRRHEQGRRIRRRPSRDAHAHPPQWPIPQAKLAARPSPHHGVSVEDAGLEPQDVIPDPADRLEVRRIGPAKRRGKLRRGHANFRRIERPAVQPGRVVQNGRQSPALDVGADPLDDLLRGQCLAKRRDRPGPALRRDDIAPRAELPAQVLDRLAGVVRGAVDPRHLQRHRHCGGASKVRGHSKREGKSMLPPCESRGGEPRVRRRSGEIGVRSALKKTPLSNEETSRSDFSRAYEKGTLEGPTEVGPTPLDRTKGGSAEHVRSIYCLGKIDLTPISTHSPGRDLPIDWRHDRPAD